MNSLDNIKKTRFKISVFIVSYLMIACSVSLWLGYTDVCIIAIGAMASEGGIYKYSETKRKSSDLNHNTESYE